MISKALLAIRKNRPRAQLRPGDLDRREESTPFSRASPQLGSIPHQFWCQRQSSIDAERVCVCETQRPGCHAGFLTEHISYTSHGGQVGTVSTVTGEKV